MFDILFNHRLGLRLWFRINLGYCFRLIHWFSLRLQVGYYGLVVNRWFLLLIDNCLGVASVRQLCIIIHNDRVASVVVGRFVFDDHVSIVQRVVRRAVKVVERLFFGLRLGRRNKFRLVK